MYGDAGWALFSGWNTLCCSVHTVALVVKVQDRQVRMISFYHRFSHVRLIEMVLCGWSIVFSQTWWSPPLIIVFIESYSKPTGAHHHCACIKTMLYCLTWSFVWGFIYSNSHFAKFIPNSSQTCHNLIELIHCLVYLALITTNTTKEMTIWVSNWEKPKKCKISL